jgi:DnaJ-class molecular chaperone
MSTKESKSYWTENNRPACNGTGKDKNKTHAPGAVSAAICQTCHGTGRKQSN